MKSIIDYIIVKQKSKFQIHDVRVQRGINCGSDHYVVRAKVYLPIPIQMIPIDRWVQYYQDLLTENRPEYKGNKNISLAQMDGEIVEVSEERVRKAVRELKNGKSCGPEGVYTEMLKHGTDKLIKMLTWIINNA